MEVLADSHNEDNPSRIQPLTSSEQLVDSSAEIPKKSSKVVKPSGLALTSRTSETISSMNKRIQGAAQNNISSSRSKVNATKTAVSSNVAPSQRRNSSGDVPPKRPSSAAKLKENGTENAKKIVPSVSDPGKRSSLENRRMSLPSLYSKSPATVSRSQTIKSSPVSRLSLKSDISKSDAVRKTSTKPFVPESVPSSRRVTSSSVDGSISRNSLRKITSNTSLSAAHSPSATGNFKLRSMSSSVDRGLSSSSRKKTSALEGRDSRFMMLPQVDVKAGDELFAVRCLPGKYVVEGARMFALQVPRESLRK